MEETRTTHPPADSAAATPIEGKKRTILNTVQFDLEAYMPLLEDTDIPDDEKLDLLRALYAIMASFVDLGFSIENPPCGKPQELADPSAQAVRDHVYSSHHNFIERFENAAGPVRDAAQEGVEA